MSRIINPEGAAKERTQLTRAIVLALRELMRQQDVSKSSRDLAAFIGLALQELYTTVDSSVGAWEKTWLLGESGAISDGMGLVTNPGR